MGNGVDEAGHIAIAPADRSPAGDAVNPFFIAAGEPLAAYPVWLKRFGFEYGSLFARVSAIGRLRRAGYILGGAGSSFDHFLAVRVDNLSPGRAQGILDCLCRAVEAAHRYGLVSWPETTKASADPVAVTLFSYGAAPVGDSTIPPRTPGEGASDLPPACDEFSVSTLDVTVPPSNCVDVAASLREGTHHQRDFSACTFVDWEVLLLEESSRLDRRQGEAVPYPELPKPPATRLDRIPSKVIGRSPLVTISTAVTLVCALIAAVVFSGAPQPALQVSASLADERDNPARSRVAAADQEGAAAGAPAPLLLPLPAPAAEIPGESAGTPPGDASSGPDAEDSAPGDSRAAKPASAKDTARPLASEHPTAMPKSVRPRRHGVIQTASLCPTCNCRDLAYKRSFTDEPLRREEQAFLHWRCRQ